MLVSKAMLDRRVAGVLGKKVRDVSVVTQALLDEVIDALANEGEVRLDGLGTMRITARTQNQRCTFVSGNQHRKGPRRITVMNVAAKYYVALRKGTRLRAALSNRRRSKVMEKYGVDENNDDAELEKKAAQGCPKCGGKVEKHGNTLMCVSKCGTEPWEAQKKT